MFKHNYLFFAILTILFTACQGLDVPGENGEEIEYKISIGGEIKDIYYTDFTKSSDYYKEHERMLAINVYVYQESTDSYEIYAGGRFLKGYSNFSDSDFTIKLQQGHKYKLCASYIYQSDYYYSYTNSFDYSIESPKDLCTGTIRTGLSSIVTYPEFERYYCEEIVIVNDNMPSLIALDMKRCAAKLSITCDDLTYGKIRAVLHFKDSIDYIYTGNYQKATIEITPQKKTAEYLFSFKDAVICWQQDQSYIEHHKVDFYYIGDGGHETLFHSDEIPFRRNKITNVSVTMKGTGDTNVAFSMESDFTIGDVIQI